MFIRICCGVLGLTCAALANAADEGGQFYGLLRQRDLSPFGFLRLDMRPAHAVSIQPGSWAIETEIGYQNTWALSKGVEDYFISLEPSGVMSNFCTAVVPPRWVPVKGTCWNGSYLPVVASTVASTDWSKVANFEKLPPIHRRLPDSFMSSTFPLTLTIL